MELVMVREAWHAAVHRVTKNQTQLSDCTALNCHLINRQAAAAPAKSLQPCPTLCDPMDCSPPGSSVCGIFQARVLERGVILL